MAEKMQALLDFVVRDDYIQVGKNRKLYFIKLTPPNLSIMTESEIVEQIEQMRRLFDNLRVKIALFITDKMEDLRTQKAFYNSLSSEFEYIKIDVIDCLNNTEKNNLAVQRAYYFIFEENQRGELDNILSIFASSGYVVELAYRKELVHLMRNYFTKEFEITDLYTIEQEIVNSNSKKEIKDAVLEKEVTKRIIPNRIDFKITHIRHNNVFRKVLLIKNFPDNILPATLLRAARIRGTTFTIRYTPLAVREAKDLIDKQQAIQKGKTLATKTTEADDARRAQQLMHNFYREISSRGSAVYLVNVYIELTAETMEELKDLQATVMSYFDTGVTVDEMVYEQRRGFLGVNPLGRETCANVANNLPSNTAAALYPCSHSALLHEKGMLLGRTADGGTFMPDLNYRDNLITSGDVTVTGMKGQGKTYLLRKLIEFNYIFGDKVYILDPENEYVDQVDGMGGTVLNCASGNFKINPFEVRRLFTEEEIKSSKRDLEDMQFNTNNQAMFLQHISWLTDFFQVLFPTTDIITIKLLMQIVQDTYTAKGIGVGTDFSKLIETDYPTFTDLYETATRDEYNGRMDTRTIQEIRLLIKDCYDGTLSIILNGYTNIVNARLICFAIGELLEGSQERLRAVLFNITSYIWNIILSRKSNVFLVLDELYLFLENELMAKYLKSYVKRDRKYDAKLCIATQQVADCLQGNAKQYATAIFDNSPYQFNFYPGPVDITLAKSALHLTDGEYNAIKVPNKTNCLARIGNASYYVKIGSLPFENALFGTKSGI